MRLLMNFISRPSARGVAAEVVGADQDRCLRRGLLLAYMADQQCHIVVAGAAEDLQGSGASADVSPGSPH